MRAQDGVVAGKREGVEVRRECLVVDGEWRCTVDAGTRNTFTIGHRDPQCVPGLELQRRAARHVLSDEVVRGAGVKELEECGIPKP